MSEANSAASGQAGYLSSIAGGAASGLFGMVSTGIANAMNRREAKAQRDWQTIMSNTAYRRAKADLIGANMNPLLAAMKGGATTPSGGMARMSATTAKPVASAMAARRLQAELARLGEETNQLRQLQLKTGQETATSAAQQRALEAETRLKTARLPWEQALSDIATSDWGTIIRGVGVAGGAGGILGVLRIIGNTLQNSAKERQANPGGPGKRLDVRQQQFKPNPGGPRPPAVERYKAPRGRKSR